MCTCAEARDDVFVAGDISTGGAEGFCERAHEDIDIARIDTEVIDNTTAVGTHCADRVGFVDV